MSKLAIQAESESDKYDYKTDVICFECGGDFDKAAGTVGCQSSLSCLGILLMVESQAPRGCRRGHESHDICDPS